MATVIGHIIGIDEIHKKKLIKQLPSHIRIIDLDQIQQFVYNDKKLVKEKIIWGEISKDIIIKQGQKRIAGSKYMSGGSKYFDRQIKKLMTKRNMVRKKIHETWREKMTDTINGQLQYRGHILFLGFNIFPKDYRVKINLPIQPLPPNTLSNKLIYDTKASSYAANQIKFYLKTYQNKIIEGSFNLNLLNKNYLANRYEKFYEHYHKQGYSLVGKDDVLNNINKLDQQLICRDKIADKNVYIATLFKSGETIPVNFRTPIEGFINREDAINNIKSKIKNNTPIYLYKIPAEQFQITNNRLMAINELRPIDEESFLLTV